MKTFVDNAQRTWTLIVNVTSIKRVRDLLTVDLLEVLEGKLIDRLIRDPVLLCDVIYALCKSEAEAAQVSDEDFGRAMAGDAIEHATKALLEELVNFSPNPKDRANLTKLLTVTWMTMDNARDRIGEKINSGEAVQAIESALATAGV